MATRIVSGVLAIAGAVAVAVGGYLPYAEQGKFDLRIFETKAPHAVLFYAVEPAAVCVAAGVLGILLFVRKPFRITPGVLLGTGVQTALFFLGYVGYAAQTNFGADVKAGGWVGMAGGALIAAAGGVALGVPEGRTTATRAAAPGWYADPGAPSLLRYWSGTAWTEHTHRGSHEPTTPATPAPGMEAPG